MQFTSETDSLFSNCTCNRNGGHHECTSGTKAGCAVHGSRAVRSTSDATDSGGVATFNCVALSAADHVPAVVATAASSWTPQTGRPCHRPESDVEGRARVVGGCRQTAGCWSVSHMRHNCNMTEYWSSARGQQHPAPSELSLQPRIRQRREKVKSGPSPAKSRPATDLLRYALAPTDKFPWVPGRNRHWQNRRDRSETASCRQ